jgi:hypothetical protein
MDIRLIILAVVFVVLMVAFGHNPMEEPKDTRGGDPFQRSLEDRLKQNNSMTSGSGYGGMATNPVAQPMQPQQQQPKTGLGLPPGSYPGMQQPSWNQSPPPKSAPEPAFYLTDGRRIFFQGYKVFTLATDGTLEPLADGNYALKDGTPIIMQNGERQSTQ